MSPFELVDESEEKPHTDWLRSLSAVEGARSLALLRLAELTGSTTTKKKRSEAAEALERTAAELHMLLGDEASSSGNPDASTLASCSGRPDDSVINTLVANSVLVLKHRTLSAWEDIHRLQRLFWLALASFAPSTLSATTEKRRQVLIDHALNPDHLVQLASSRGEGRSAWLPSRHPADLRQSCEYVSMMFHTVDLLSGVAIDCLEGKRALQRSPSPSATDSPPISKRSTRAARDGPPAAPSVSPRKLSLLAGQPSLFVPLGPRYQAEVPAFAPHEEVHERGDELLVIEFVPAAPPQRLLPTPSSALKSEEAGEEEGGQPMDEDDEPLEAQMFQTMVQYFILGGDWCCTSRRENDGRVYPLDPPTLRMPRGRRRFF